MSPHHAHRVHRVPPPLSRRRLLGLAASTAAALPLTHLATGATRAHAADQDGRGVSLTPFDGATEALGEVGASWYYTWASTTGDTARPEGVEFVPMIWGADSVNDADLENARREGEVLLGFNEPDLAEQADMTVESALDLWPRLQATELRLGAPAVAGGGDQEGGWLDRFLSGAADRGYRVDFVPLHWYGADFGPDAVEHLRGYLQAVHDRYQLPLWLTEYALIDFSGGSPRYPGEQEQVDFVRGAGEMLAQLPFVERHAWFTLSTGTSPTGLHDGQGANATGEAYREAG
ncbi:glycoside hydrolase family protein [Streptomyces sp. NPDC005438]|uniref:glycoside hydrolase family protein n=1 Tax=Streptomyces sp. NPDC005438 TaxID=3156880 RepID=UPI0033ABB8CE